MMDWLPVQAEVDASSAGRPAHVGAVGQTLAADVSEEQVGHDLEWIWRYNYLIVFQFLPYRQIQLRPLPVS